MGVGLGFRGRGRGRVLGVGLGLARMADHDSIQVTVGRLRAEVAALRPRNHFLKSGFVCSSPKHQSETSLG